MKFVKCISPISIAFFVLMLSHLIYVLYFEVIVPFEGIEWDEKIAYATTLKKVLSENTKKSETNIVASTLNVSKHISSEVIELNKTNKEIPSLAPSKHVSSEFMEKKGTNTEAPSPGPLKQECFISSYSIDGIGHQMEAKISCLATALILNSKRATTGTWTYIHQPVAILEHGQKPSEMEDLFGFSKMTTNIFDSQLMDIMPRPIFACREYPDDLISDFNNLCPNQTASDTSGKGIVHSNDNCWDFIYCQIEPLPNEWHTDVVPLLRRTILSGLSYVNVEHSSNFVPQKTERIPGRCFIVMHIRLGDGGSRRMNGEWIQSVWKNLLDTRDSVNMGKMGYEETSTSDALAFHLAIHSDGTRDEVVQLLDFLSTDVFFTESFNRHSEGDDVGSSVDAANKTIVSLYCGDEDHATVAAAMYDMLTADIFVASDSSLSHTASFLRHPMRDGPSVHPPSTDFRERMGTIMGWFFLRKVLNETEMQLCSSQKSVASTQDLTKCSYWVGVEPSFWLNLFSVFFSRMDSLSDSDRSSSNILDKT